MFNFRTHIYHLTLFVDIVIFGLNFVQLPPESIFWRQLLQVVLHDQLGRVRDDWSVGKVAAKCRSFSEYARKGFQTLGFECNVSLYMNKITEMR